MEAQSKSTFDLKWEALGSFEKVSMLLDVGVKLKDATVLSKSTFIPKEYEKEIQKRLLDNSWVNFRNNCSQTKNGIPNSPSDEYLMNLFKKNPSNISATLFDNNKRNS